MLFTAFLLLFWFFFVSDFLAGNDMSPKSMLQWLVDLSMRAGKVGCLERAGGRSVGSLVGRYELVGRFAGNVHISTARTATH